MFFCYIVIYDESRPLLDRYIKSWSCMSFASVSWKNIFIFIYLIKLSLFCWKIWANAIKILKIMFKFTHKVWRVIYSVLNNMYLKISLIIYTTYYGFTIESINMKETDFLFYLIHKLNCMKPLSSQFKNN